MKRVLVTGANGFLGRWVVQRLCQLGHQITILARPTSDLSLLSECQYSVAYGDVTQPETLIKAMKEIDTVFHLAGVIAYKAADRDLMWSVNVEGTRNVVQSMEQLGLKDLVYLSSVVAIGASLDPTMILNESSPFEIHQLNLGYFESKHAAEKIVVAAFERGTLLPTIVNPSTIYGAGDATKGSRRTQLKVAQGKFPFYARGGVNVVAVEDCIDGIFLAWEKGRRGQRYILAGENILIRDLLAMIAAAAGVPAPKYELTRGILLSLGWIGDCLILLGIRVGFSVENAWTSTLYHWFDSTLAQKELGFRPRPAREAILNSVQWMKLKGLV